jgi:hypothetical protein
MFIRPAVFTRTSQGTLFRESVRNAYHLHPPTSRFFKLYLDITLPSLYLAPHMSSFPFRLFDQNCISISHPSHACWWRAETEKYSFNALMSSVNANSNIIMHLSGRHTSTYYYFIVYKWFHWLAHYAPNELHKYLKFRPIHTSQW